MKIKILYSYLPYKGERNEKETEASIEFETGDLTIVWHNLNRNEITGLDKETGEEVEKYFAERIVK